MTNYPHTFSVQSIHHCTYCKGEDYRYDKKFNLASGVELIPSENIQPTYYGSSPPSHN